MARVTRSSTSTPRVRRSAAAAVEKTVTAVVTIPVESEDIPAPAQPGPTPIRVGVLTVSDRCSAGEREDLSGPAIQTELPEGTYTVVLYAVVPDDRKVIAETLKRWTDHFDCDVILTTGGTGFGPRDVTPEATRKVIERLAAGISHYLLTKGIESNPLAALSRGIAGIRTNTLIVNLPGSPTGARECADWLLPLLPHAVDVLRGRDHATPGDSAA